MTIGAEHVGLVFLGVVDGRRGTWYVVSLRLMVCLTAPVCGRLR